MKVHIVRGDQPTFSDTDCVCVHCVTDIDTMKTYTCIERVFSVEPSKPLAWHIRPLLKNALMPLKPALRFAKFYAKKKKIPVIYADLSQCRKKIKKD